MKYGLKIISETIYNTFLAISGEVIPNRICMNNIVTHIINIDSFIVEVYAEQIASIKF